MAYAINYSAYFQNHPWVKSSKYVISVLGRNFKNFRNYEISINATKFNFKNYKYLISLILHFIPTRVKFEFAVITQIRK